MTVSTETNKAAYIGNGIATSFAVPFPFLEQTHLTVCQLSDGVQTELTDWTVSDGNMIFTTPPPDGAKIVILREVPMTQETDYRENEILSAETMERNFDKLTMLAQQLKEEQDRSIKVNVFSTVAPNELERHIERVWTSCDNIDTAAGNSASISAVAANISDVNTAAANIAAIVDAPNQASSAATSAASAQDWAIKTDGPVEGADYSAKWYALNTDASGKANKDLSNLSAAGETHFADPDLSDLSATGEAHFADPDLANLSAAGNDKFVTKDTAQTISGAKTFDELKTTAVLSAADDSQNVPSTSWIKDYAGVVDYSNLTDVTSSVFASSGIGYKPAVKGLLLIKTRNSVNKSYFWIYNATGTVIFNRLFNSSEGSMDVSGGTATLPLTPDFSIRVGTQAGTAGSDYWAVFYPYKA